MTTSGQFVLRRVDPGALVELNLGREVSVCQTPQWLEFLRMSQAAEPVVLEVLRHGQQVGFFTGALVRKAGLRILGSPLRGWTTSYMGFDVDEDVDPSGLLAPLRAYAFGELSCVHVELLDRRIEDEVAGWQSRLLHGYEIDLTRNEEELFAAMSPACRRCIRKSEKLKVTIEIVSDPAGFAADYFSQLRQVFAKQSLVPPYPQQRVEQLIGALHPAGMLLLVRARDAARRSIATSIFPGHGNIMYFWGGASAPEGLPNRPNEAMIWEAMRYWKERGVQRFDMGGGGEYKAKYGGRAIAVPWLRCSRSGVVSLLRTSAEAALRLKQRVRGSGKRGS